MSDELLKSFLDPRRLERIERVASLRTDSLTVVLDRVHNAHNMSAVLRSADAFGLRDVHVVGELDIADGIALGTNHWLNIHLHASPSEALRVLKADGYSMVVTAPEDQRDRAPGVQSLAVFQLPFEKRLAMVFGNEKQGVSPELFAAAEYHAYIPMFGFVESLNISVAAAICLFASTVQVGPGRRVHPLPDPDREQLVSEWLRRNFDYADKVDRELARRKQGSGENE